MSKIHNYLIQCNTVDLLSSSILEWRTPISLASPHWLTVLTVNICHSSMKTSLYHKRKPDTVSCHRFLVSTYAFVLNPQPLHLVINFLVVRKTGECAEWQQELTSSVQPKSKLGCTTRQNPMVLLTLNWENSLKRRPVDKETLKRDKADDSVDKALAVST